MEGSHLLRRIRILLSGFVIGLALSGITAFPLPAELTLLSHWMGVPDGVPASHFVGITGWIVQIRDALAATQSTYPFLFYGYDWLAFAHLVIASLFWGPLRDPVRNVWVIQWGMFACVATWPIAFICGPLRGIPIFWQLIDCSFGFVGLFPLYAVYRMIRRLEVLSSS